MLQFYWQIHRTVRWVGSSALEGHAVSLFSTETDTVQTSEHGVFGCTM